MKNRGYLVDKLGGLNSVKCLMYSVDFEKIEGLDLRADGGTHVRNTVEVEKIKIIDYISNRLYMFFTVLG